MLLIARTVHPEPRGRGQLRWRRAFKPRSKQVRSDRARSPRQAAPAENLKGTLFAGGPGAAPAGAGARASDHTPPSPALPGQTRGAREGSAHYKTKGSKLRGGGT